MRNSVYSCSTELHEMLAPQPRLGSAGDTYAVDGANLPTTPIAVDPRDPRSRSFGHIAPENMEAGRQTQDMLAVSASMRTALLVYSGITVKMMVDSDLGAALATMFMVQYEQGGFAGAHDHRACDDRRCSGSTVVIRVDAVSRVRRRRSR